MDLTDPATVAILGAVAGGAIGLVSSLVTWAASQWHEKRKSEDDAIEKVKYFVNTAYAQLKSARDDLKVTTVRLLKGNPERGEESGFVSVHLHPILVDHSIAFGLGDVDISERLRVLNTSLILLNRRMSLFNAVLAEFWECDKVGAFAEPGKADDAGWANLKARNLKAGIEFPFLPTLTAQVAACITSANGVLQSLHKKRR